MTLGPNGSSIENHRESLGTVPQAEGHRQASHGRASSELLGQKTVPDFQTESIVGRDRSTVHQKKPRDETA